MGRGYNNILSSFQHSQPLKTMLPQSGPQPGYTNSVATGTDTQTIQNEISISDLHLAATEHLQVSQSRNPAYTLLNEYGNPISFWSDSDLHSDLGPYYELGGLHPLGPRSRPLAQRMQTIAVFRIARL